MGKIILTSVPIPCSEFNSIPNPNLLHNFLHKYNPIPVDFLLIILPFSPVKPFSNTLVISPFLIPIPLSLIYKITLSFFSCEEISTFLFSFFEYFIAFCII